MSRVPGFPEFRPGQPVSLQEMRRIATLIDRTERGDGTPGSDIDVGGGGLTFANSFPQGFWARLTASYGSQGCYAWTGMQDSTSYVENPGGAPPTFISSANGFAGTTSLLPAFEITGNDGLKVNSPAVNVSNVSTGTTTTTVTTSTPHGAQAGQEVVIAGVGGATQANGTFVVQSVLSTTEVEITTATTSAYTSGGTLQVQNGSVQWLRQGLGEYYWFSSGGGGSGGGGGTTVRVASSTLDPTSKMWPAFVQVWSDGTPATKADGTACWAIGLNASTSNPAGGPLIAEYYPAVFATAHAADGKSVYACGGIAIGVTCASGAPQLLTV